MKSQIRSLSDSQLLIAVKNSVLEERKHTAAILEYLKEIDRRRLYADSGHASLWDFCTKELGYSEASASRRISSMRLLRDLPYLKEDLLVGKQNLSSLAQAQKFFRIEEKHRDVKFSQTEKKQVLEKIEGKSTRECERELLRLSSAPMEITRPEKQRALGDSHTELRLVLDSELLDKLNRIQALRSHAQPSMSYTELLQFMADEVLKNIDPMLKVKAPPSAPEVKRSAECREELGPEKTEASDGVKISKRVPIPSRVKREVWVRDQGKCGFVNRETGKRCDSRHFIEIDHVNPVALGGGNETENLRLRCRAHNQRAAVRVFGVRSWDGQKDKEIRVSL